MVSPLPALRRKRNSPALSWYSSNLPAMSSRPLSGPQPDAGVQPQRNPPCEGAAADRPNRERTRAEQKIPPRGRDCLVGDTGLEPVTSSVSGKRATRLRQSPVQDSV